MVQSAEGNVIDYRTGARKRVVPTQDEIEQSDLLREEAWKDIEERLKYDLNEKDMMDLRIAFYKASQNYLFVGRKK